MQEIQRRQSRRVRGLQAAIDPDAAADAAAIAASGANTDEDGENDQDQGQQPPAPAPITDMDENAATIVALVANKQPCSPGLTGRGG